MAGQFVIAWQYEVTELRCPDFERAYGPAGDWARLFATAAGLIETELLSDGAGRYITLDRWQSPAGFDAFQARAGDAYDALDAKCDALTVSEERLGTFTTK